MRQSLIALLLAPLLALAALALPASALARTEQAVFSGGCFWCMEHDMKAVPGVISVESGYTGGTVDHPTYEQVSGERTGHYESVRVTFDPDKLPYGLLMQRYWRLVDPTDDSGQFCDRGPSYRTAIFVANAAQRQAAEASKAAAAKLLKRGKIITPILPLGPFWPAEEYHRNYSERNALNYNLYRMGCGRDARLAAVWGKAGQG